MYRLYFYLVLTKITAVIHLFIIFINFISIPMVIYYEPFYIWMPIVTLLVSPVIGSTYCMFNRLENYFRAKSLQPLINDRFEAFITDITNFFKRSK